MKARTYRKKKPYTPSIEVTTVKKPTAKKPAIGGELKWKPAK